VARLSPLLLVALASVAIAGSARSSALSVAVVSVGAASNSATVSWRATAPVRAVVEYGTTGEYGIWTQPSALAVAGRVVLPALEPGTQYQFRVLGLTAEGTRVEAAGSVKTHAIGPLTTATTTPNALVVNGQPLFPRMQFQTCSYYYTSSIADGINAFMGSRCSTGTDQLRLLAGRAFSILPLRQRGAIGRGLIGQFQPDEPEGHGLTALPTLPSSKLSGRVTFLTLTDHFSVRSAPLPNGETVYRQLFAKAEMIGFDSYPLQVRCSGDFTLVYDLQHELAALTGKPTYQWIETGRMGTCGHNLDPTAATVRAEAWLAIAGGARGIGYFPDFWPPDIAAAISETNHTIAGLARALLAPEALVSVAPDGTPVKAGARLLNGAYYVVAANPSYTPASATFTVPGVADGLVRVYGEGRTLPVSSGQFTDSFAGLGAHIYIAAPPGL